MLGTASRTLGIGRAEAQLIPDFPFPLQPPLERETHIDNPLKEELHFIFHSTSVTAHSLEERHGRE